MAEPGRQGPRLVLAVLVFALLAGFVLAHFEMSSDVTHFLPDAEGRAAAAISRQLANSELSRTLILALEASDREASLAASRAFEERLRADATLMAGTAFLESGPAPGIDRALFELYEPRRLSFFAGSEAEARESTSEEGLARAARALREELAGPLSAMVSRVAGRDPFLSIPTLFRRLESSRAGGELTVEDGRFLTRDGRTAILFLGTKASALDANAQTPLLAAIDAAFAAVAAEQPGKLRLEHSGLHRIATHTARTIEADIRRVSILSSCVLSVLLLLLFRSLRFVALAAIPIAYGVAAGAACVLLLFGRLHGVTLAFGAALIGVSIDYVVHLYCHHTIVSPAGGPQASLRAIARPLATGAITTVAGFLALSASSLSGLREITVFAVFGLAAAFTASVALVPHLMGAGGGGLAAHPRWVEGVGAAFRALARRRLALAALPAAGLAVVAVGLPRAHFNPDLSSLSRTDPELMAENERVRAKVSPVEQSRLAVALGDDDASALALNDAVSDMLEKAVAAGELSGQRSLAALLPSPARQRRIAAVLTEDPELPERLQRVFAAAGFAPGAFAPFLASLAEPLPPPLEYDTLLDSPAASLVRPFRVHLGEQVGFVSFLQGVREPERLEERLAPLRDALLLDQRSLFSDAQLVYQRSTARLLAGGLVAVLALLALRYRDLRRTLVALGPSVLAAAVTVSALALAGRGLDLISLTALLFVVSMGVDYSVFLVDANDEEEPRSLAAALTGALLAGSSTVVAFGLLALSEHPVLSGLGITAAVGISSSLVLAPASLLLLQPAARQEGVS